MTSHHEAWDQAGFFIVPGLVDATSVARIEEEVIDRIRSDPPERHPGRPAYFSGENYFITTETAPSPLARDPEDKISKVFNCHAEGETRRVAGSDPIVDRVAAHLVPHPDSFQTHFISKNPTVTRPPC